MSGTTLYSLLTGRPQPPSRSYQPDWVSGAPSRWPSSPGPAASPLMPVPSGRAFDPADAVHDRVERPGRGDLGVLLPQRAGRRVPRVGEGGLARVEQRLVQLAERLDRHEHLAPDLQHGRMPGALQPGRDRGDGPDVRRDVLAGAPVAPGRRLDQRAVPVDEVDGQPVDLQLAQEGPAVPPSLTPGRPAAQVLEGENVVQAEQPFEVLDRGEQGGDRPVHGLGRRVRRAQVRVLLLERAQLAHLGVVVDVGDRRRVEDVVPVVGLGDLQAQVGVPFARLGRRLLRRSFRCHSLPLSPSPRSAQPACSPPPGTASTRRAPGGGGAGHPARRSGHNLVCAGGQREPQAVPQPDDPFRGLAGPGAAVTGGSAAPRRRPGPPGTPAPVPGSGDGRDRADQQPKPGLGGLADRVSFAAP